MAVVKGLSVTLTTAFEQLCEAPAGPVLGPLESTRLNSGNTPRGSMEPMTPCGQDTTFSRLFESGQGTPGSPSRHRRTSSNLGRGGSSARYQTVSRVSYL